MKELKLRDAHWQIFFADLVEAADDAALEQRPEAFSRVRVNSADNVLLRGVLNATMRVTRGARPSPTG